jgi:hypothetical protein
VGDEEVHWSEGTGFFLDDTFRHEAWNKTPEVRVVLLLDTVRPLSFPHSVLNKAIIYGMARSPGIRSLGTRLREIAQREVTGPVGWLRRLPVCPVIWSCPSGAAGASSGGRPR